MANLVKLKRGSGSDPSASDLVVGEVAIRTDNGKLFTKKDNGTIAEISGSGGGGGSDIFINTLSSSSGSGGGSATFNGTATRFTLSNPPDISAQQLLVSINGVIQKPNSGTSPSEGFAIDGADIIFAAAPETGDNFFIVTYGTIGVSEPADNSVTSAKIVNGAIVNDDVNTNAAIAGTKISPNFGSQNIITTGDISLNGTNPTISFIDSNENADFRLFINVGKFRIQDVTDSNSDRFIVHTDGHIDIPGNLDVGAGVDVTGGITATADLTLDTGGSTGINLKRGGTLQADIEIGSASDELAIRARGSSGFINLATGSSGTERMRIDSSGRVLIGTTTEGRITGDHFTIASNGHTGMTIRSGTSAGGNIFFSDGTSGNDELRGVVSYDHTNNFMRFYTNATEKLRIDSAGKVGIGTTAPEVMLDIRANDPGIQLVDTSGTSTYGNIDFVGDTLILTSRGGASSDGGIDFRGYDGTTVDTNMRIRADGNVQIPNDSKELQLGASQDFRLFHDGSANKIIAQNAELLTQCETYSIRSENGGTIYATIDNAGRILINSSATSTTLNGGEAKYFDSGDGCRLMSGRASTGAREHLVFFNPNGDVGDITTSGSNTAFNTSSDYRLKENQVLISDGITRLKTLKPYKFNWKVDTSTIVDGFFAHEVSTAVREAVTGEKDATENCSNVVLDKDGKFIEKNVTEEQWNLGKAKDPATYPTDSTWSASYTKNVYQKIDHSKLVPLLTAALQEAIGKIETLETKVAALEAG